MEEEIGEVNEVVIGGIREIEVEEGWEEMLKKLRKERKMKGRKWIMKKKELRIRKKGRWGLNIKKGNEWK